MYNICILIMENTNCDGVKHYYRLRRWNNAHCNQQAERSYGRRCETHLRSVTYTTFDFVENLHGEEENEVICKW